MHRGKTSAASTPGSFAPHTRSEGEVDLDTVPQSVDGELTFERWDGDYAVNVGSADVDLAAVFDTFSLDDLPEDEDAMFRSDKDWIFEACAKHGVGGADKHHGPFTVDVNYEEYTEYLEARRALGQEAPLRATVLRDISDITRDFEELDREERSIARRRADLVRHYMTAQAHDICPDVAKVVVRWNPEDSSISEFTAFDKDGAVVDDPSVRVLQVITLNTLGRIADQKTATFEVAQ